MSELSIKERLKLYIKEKGLSQSKFEKMANLSNGFVNNISKGIGSEKLQSIFCNFPDLNRDWLLTGEGSMLTSININLENSGSTTYYFSQKKEFEPKPHISSVSAICGRPSGFEVAVKKQDCEMLPLPVREEYDFSIIAKGDSMINHDNPERSIKAGDYIACRIWTSRSYVRWGEVYALATADGVVVKKIMPSDREGMIKCVSFNEKDGYLPFNLKIDEIFDWALVIAVVSVNKWN